MAKSNSINILIVANQREQVRLLRTSLELLEADLHIVDALSGEEAQLEFSKGFDLIITDFRLSGMTGSELIKRAAAKMRDVRAIVITDQAIREVEKECKGLPVEAIIEKPIEAAQVSKAVQQALFGEVTAEEVSSGGPKGTGPLSTVDDVDFGPIPEVDLAAIQRVLASHVTEIGALGIAFVTRKGEILFEGGQFDHNLRFSEVAIFLARALVSASTIADYIGPIPSNMVQYYDGKHYDIFSISAGVHFFVALVYPGDSQKELGAVMRFRRKIIWQVIDVIGVDIAMGREGSQVALEALADMMVQEAEEKMREEAESRAVESQMAFVTEDDEAEAEALEAELGDIFNLESDEVETEAIEIDLLDLEVEDIGDGDLDGFWDDAAEDAGKIREDSISMEEAMELGLLDDLE
jgi:CheY-like chemotaxis protein